MYRILTLLFLLMSCTSYGQSGKVEIYGTISGGLDKSMGTLMSGKEHSAFNYFRNAEPIKSPCIFLGIQMHLLDRWTFTTRFGFTGMGSAFRYQDNPTSYGEGIQAIKKEKWSWNRQEAVYYYNGKVVTGWVQPFKRIVVTDEYNFYRLRFKKGICSHFGIHFNAGVGLDYTFLSKNNRTDSLRNFHPVSLGRVAVKGLEKQNRNGAGGILAGLNAQIVYKEKKYLKFGVWYHYMPHPNVEYHMTLSYEEKEDHFNLYGAKHQWLFFVEIPIRIYSSDRNKEE